MYGFVGWNDLGTMVVRDGISSRFAWRTVNEVSGDSIMFGGLFVVLPKCHGSNCVGYVRFLHESFA